VWGRGLLVGCGVSSSFYSETVTGKPDTCRPSQLQSNVAHVKRAGGGVARPRRGIVGGNNVRERWMGERRSVGTRFKERRVQWVPSGESDRCLRGFLTMG
jgi:hypothetical protein